MSKPAPLAYGQYYHIYSRGNNRGDIFKDTRNYAYFLKLYAHHIEPIADTYAYCLMRNHFHVLIRVRDTLDPKGFGNPSGLGARPTPSQSVSNLLNAYTKAINKAYERTGSLFEHPFGRIEVASDTYFTRLIAYIHRNPQKHRFVADFRDWPYSSYQTMTSTKPTHIKRVEVLAWFDGVAYFVTAHQADAIDRGIPALTPDDFD